MYVPIYNKATGMYGGLTKKLAHIILRGDTRFFSYGYSKEKKCLIVLYHEASFTKHFLLHCL